jgi:hypothetical protein
MRPLVTLCDMSVTAPVDERHQFLGAIDRLVKSQALHSSESLCKLLRYLAEQSLQNPGATIKEYQIATEVFGRPADFDPHSDSAIRVQAGRLRAKLADYYTTEGSGDPIVVDLPKGSYTLSFHHRQTVAPSIEPILHAAERRSSFRHLLLNWATSVVALSILLAAGVAALVVRFETKQKATIGATQAAQVPSSIKTFWKMFASGPEEPSVVFSNAAFVGRPETGMRYRNADDNAQVHILDHYTGVGEVIAVHELDHVFHLLNSEVRVKRGSLFSLDDAKNNNLIFVGSPAENLSLRDIPMNEQFVFRRLESGPRKGDLALSNLHPKDGESAYFLGSPITSPLTEDYAVIALMRGMNPTESVLILAGTTTLGTQAAVEYVCHEDSLSQLLARLGVPPSGEVKPFEVVLHVKVARGVPIASEIVAVRD